MDMLAVIGSLVILVMMLMILKNKALPLFCFAVLPVIGAFCAGFSVKEVLEFVNKGVGTTWKTAVLFIFSVVYFGVMNDAGMFDRMVNALLKVAGRNITLLFIATVLIATVGHIDGATASTYLISFPVMLPIFKRLKLNPLVLLLLVASATGIMNLVPWGGPTIRAATAIKGDANALWHAMIPMQIFGLLASCVLAVYFAHSEKKRLAAEGVDGQSGICQAVRRPAGGRILRGPSRRRDRDAAVRLGEFCRAPQGRQHLRFTNHRGGEPQRVLRLQRQIQRRGGGNHTSTSG